MVVIVLLLRQLAELVQNVGVAGRDHKDAANMVPDVLVLGRPDRMDVQLGPGVEPRCLAGGL